MILSSYLFFGILLEQRRNSKFSRRKRYHVGCSHGTNGEVLKHYQICYIFVYMTWKSELARILSTFFWVDHTSLPCPILKLEHSIPFSSLLSVRPCWHQPGQSPSLITIIHEHMTEGQKTTLNREKGSCYLFDSLFTNNNICILSCSTITCTICL